MDNADQSPLLLPVGKKGFYRSLSPCRGNARNFPVDKKRYSIVVFMFNVLKV
jgi:hypothetical protein